MWGQLAMMAGQALLGSAMGGGGGGGVAPPTPSNRRMHSVAGADGPDFYEKLLEMDREREMASGAMSQGAPSGAMDRIGNKFGDFTSGMGDFAKEMGPGIAMSLLAPRPQAPVPPPRPSNRRRNRYYG